MKLKIEIDMDNSAFEDDPLEEARRSILSGFAILRETDYGPRDHHRLAGLKDINGNTVGYIHWRK